MVGFLRAMFGKADPLHTHASEVGELDDSELGAVTDWMTNNDINLDDFAFAHFRSFHCRGPGATAAVLGEGKTLSDAPRAFMVVVSGPVILAGGIYHHGIFSEMHALAAQADAQKKLLIELVRERSEQLDRTSH